MAFPDTPIDVLVELFYDGAWHDITEDVLSRTPITIKRGRADEGQRVDPSNCSLTLNNGASKVAPGITGRYSPRNPLSDLFGKIGRNTPVRVSVREGSSYLSLPGANGDTASTPDHASLDITGSMDVRIGDVALDDWDSGTAVELAGKYTVVTDQRAWLLLYGANRDLVFRWSADGINTTQIVSTELVPVPPSGRISLRATLNTANSVVTLYTAPSIDGPWTQLGDASAAGGATSVFNSDRPVEVGGVSGLGFAGLAGSVGAFQLYDGIDGTLVADPDFTAQAAGTTSFADSAGRTWSVNGNASVSKQRIRFLGEISNWPPRWDVSGNDRWMPVEAAGILRRLGQGSSPLQSVLRRETTAEDATQPKTYWPLEDAEGSTLLASGLGASAMNINGSPDLASFSGFDCSDPIVTMRTGSSLLARVPQYPATGQTQVRCLMNVPSSGGPADAVLMQVHTTGTAARWDIVYRTGGMLEVLVYNDAGTQIGTSNAVNFQVDGKLLRVSLELTQDGADIDFEIVTFEVNGSGLVDSNTLAGRTVGRVWKITVAKNQDVDGVAFGHLALYDTITSIFDLQDATNAYFKETAGRRIERLCAENGVAFDALGGDLDDTEFMGTQRSNTLVTLLQDAADADASALIEDREDVGLAYRTRISLYNQVPLLVLGYETEGHISPPFEPEEDDQYLKNTVQASRQNGSSALYAKPSGALSVQAPPNGVGTYNGSTSVNIAYDSRLPDHAGWRVLLGTIDAPHYPVIHVNLAAAPGLIDEACQLDTGLRMTVSDPPKDVPPEDVDQLVQGYTEVIGHPNDWDLYFDGVPYLPYIVGVRDTSHRQTSGSELAAAVDEDDATLTLVTTLGPRWTSKAQDSPYDLQVGGEVVTVTAPGTLLNPNPFFGTDVTGWTGANCSIAQSTAQVHPHPRASGSMLITPNGGVAAIAADGDLTGTDTITPGASYTISAWVYSPAGWSDLRPSVHWYTNAGGFISTSGAAQAAVPAGQWTYLEDTVTAPSTAGRCKMRARSGGTPASTDIFYVWAARITRPSASLAYDAFGRTVSNSWGRSDGGQAWTQTNGAASDRSVDGAAGVITLASAVDTVRFQRLGDQVSDCEVLVRVSVDQIATGASVVPGILFRYTGTSDFYRARVHFGTGGSMFASITRAFTSVGTTPSLPYTYSAGQFFWLRARVDGDRVRLRVWPEGSVEPPDWHKDETIVTSPIAVGEVGLTGSAFSGNTNVNLAISYDDFAITDPQVFTVTRSQNGIVKSHAVGAGVAVAPPDPAVRAL